MRARLTLLLWASLLTLAACGSLNPKVDIGPEASRKIDELSRMIEKSMQGLSDAIPGGRYTRLIEDLNGTDPEKKKAAQAFLVSLGRLDPEVRYEVSVWFEFDPAKTLHAQIFSAETPSKDELVTRYTQAYVVNPANVASTPLAGPSPSGVQQIVRGRLENAISLMPQLYSQFTPSNCIGGPGHFEYPDCIAGNEAGAREEAKRVAEVMEKVTASLSGAFNAFYQDWPTPISANVLTLNWSPFDPHQALFIVVPESDWTKHGGKINVRALLHKRSDPASPLPGAQVETISADEWQSIHLTDAHQPPRDFKWAVRTMTDSNLLSASSLERVRAIQQALDAWQRLQKGSG